MIASLSIGQIYGIFLQSLNMDPDPTVVLHAASMPIEHERAHPDGALARRLVLLTSRCLANSEDALTRFPRSKGRASVFLNPG